MLHRQQESGFGHFSLLLATVADVRSRPAYFDRKTTQAFQKGLTEARRLHPRKSAENIGAAALFSLADLASSADNAAVHLGIAVRHPLMTLHIVKPTKRAAMQKEIKQQTALGYGLYGLGSLVAGSLGILTVLAPAVH